MSVLDHICAKRRDTVEAEKVAVPASDLHRIALAAPPCRGFGRALQEALSREPLAIVAEIKKASPSRGLIRQDFDPAELALRYAAGGATCLSVLTEPLYFQGSEAHLIAARSVVNLPLLRKDFIIDTYQVLQSRAMGADCILLIMAALTDGLAQSLYGEALALGLDCLVEVHNEHELSRALELGASLLGINNRDLKTLAVDLQTTERLSSAVPTGCLLVSESGIANTHDISRLTAVGVRCFLVGESLMRHDDPGMALAALLARNPQSPQSVGGVMSL